MSVGLLKRVVCSSLLLSMYSKVSKNAIDWLEMTWSNLMDACCVLSCVRNMSSLVVPPVYMKNMSSMYLA